MIKLAAVGATLLTLTLATIAGHPRQFSDPMTGGRDGGWLATWGPVTCAVWTWSRPEVVNTYVVPVNCSRT